MPHRALIPRRDFVRVSSGAAVGLALPAMSVVPRPRLPRYGPGDGNRNIANGVANLATVTTLYDPAMRALATQAVEAAVHAGADYADVRATNTITRSCPGNSAAVQQSVTLDLSVRALVKGYWGWSATNTLSPSEGVRVGQLSAQLATEAATRGRPRTVELGTIPVVQNGTWKTPLETDPFDVEVVEVFDWLRGVVAYLRDRGYGITVAMTPPCLGVSFAREERLFASSEGSLTTQTISTISPAFVPRYQGVRLPIPGYNRTLQGGWERLARHSNEELYALVETERARARPAPLTFKPAEIGRYDIVYSAAAMAEILSKTLVPATELDRALGYEANATGTSYLGPDPMTYLGTQVASPAVTVTAERSTPDAVATVKWDDEGVSPDTFSLVKNGTLIDYQTTREQAVWLAPWYQKQGRPVRSHGCAGAPSAGFVTMQHTPNIVLEPSRGSADEETLIAQMGHGLYVPGINVQMDFQSSNGLGLMGGAIEIRNGQRVAVVGFSSGSLGMLFRSADFWKNVVAVGGTASAAWDDGGPTMKGNPVQRTSYSICTVPTLVKQQAIVDPTKKA